MGRGDDPEIFYRFLLGGWFWGSVVGVSSFYAWDNAATFVGDDALLATWQRSFDGFRVSGRWAFSSGCDAATWLMANRSIKAVGIDTASIDSGQSALFDVHRSLYARDIPAFENLTDLDRLPPRGATIIALPMKIRGGSGAPLRAIAIVPS